MSKDTLAAHCAAHMSPAQAAQHAGVSRWTIMRAVKSNALVAFRDNKNQWRIHQEALDEWMSSNVRAHPPAHDVAHEVHSVAALSEIIELKEKLASALSRAEAAERARDQAEADRNRWYELATKPWWRRLIG